MAIKVWGWHHGGKRRLEQEGVQPVCWPGPFEAVERKTMQIVVVSHKSMVAIHGGHDEGHCVFQEGLSQEGDRPRPGLPEV